MEVVEDPRSLKPDICHVIKIGVTGVEWVCIKSVHNTEYRRKATDATHHGFVDGTGAHPERPFGMRAPKADQHYFVRRYPYRSKEG